MARENGHEDFLKTQRRKGRRGRGGLLRNPLCVLCVLCVSAFQKMIFADAGRAASAESALFLLGQKAGTSAAGVEPALRKSFDFLRTFLERFDLAKLKPAPALIRQGAPEHWRALGDGATRFAVYAKGAAPAEIVFALPDGRWRQRWFDTGTGMLLLEDMVVAKNGEAILKLPECCAEVALDLALEEEGRSKK